MSKAIIYVRVSSTDDKQTNDRQIDELKSKAAQDGYKDKDIIIFEDKISGFSKGDTRPAFSELLTAIRNDSKLYSMIYPDSQHVYRTHSQSSLDFCSVSVIPRSSSATHDT